jgi:hypothetical protein
VHAANVYPESTLGVHRKKQISAAAKVGLQTASYSYALKRSRLLILCTGTASATITKTN